MSVRKLNSDQLRIFKRYMVKLSELRQQPCCPILSSWTDEDISIILAHSYKRITKFNTPEDAAKHHFHSLQKVRDAIDFSGGMHVTDTQH